MPSINIQKMGDWKQNMKMIVIDWQSSGGFLYQTVSAGPVSFWWINGAKYTSKSIHWFKCFKFWINCYLTIVITYKTHWHNDISAVKTLFSQHLFTCNLCKIVLKYDLFGRHVKIFMLCLSLLFFAHHVSSLVWSTSGPFKGFGL